MGQILIQWQKDTNTVQVTYVELYLGLFPITQPTGLSMGGLELYLVFLLRGSSPT